MAVEDVNNMLARGNARHKEAQVAARRDRSSVLMATELAQPGNLDVEKIHKAVSCLFAELGQRMEEILKEDNSRRIGIATDFYRDALDGSAHVSDPDGPIALSERTQQTAEQLKEQAATFPDVLREAKGTIFAALDQALGDVAMHAHRMKALTYDIADQSALTVAASQVASERM